MDRKTTGVAGRSPDTKKPYTWVAILSQDGRDIITSQLTGEDGKCLIDDDALEDAILSGNYEYLTINVKAHNYLPYQGEIRPNYPEINESVLNVFMDNRIIFAGRTGIIKYCLRASGFVTISIYDSKGTLLKTIVNETQNAGNHSVTFSNNDLSNGIYYCKFKCNNTQSVRKFYVTR